MKKFLALILSFYSLLAQAAEPSPAAITQAELGRIVVGLLVVVGIIVLLAWLLRKVNAVQLGAGKGMRIIGSYGLGAREKIILVQIADRYLLLGVTAASINCLHDFGTTAPQGMSEESAKGFNQVLQQVLRKRK